MMVRSACLLALSVGLCVAGATANGAEGADGASLAVPAGAGLREAAAAKLAPPGADAATPSLEQFKASAATLASRYRAVDYDPDLRARELGDGVEPAFGYVRDQVRYEAYPGVLRGAKCAYITRAANAADRSLLLARLLEQKGIATRFARGRLAKEDAEKLLARVLEPAAMAAPGEAKPAADPAQAPPQGAQFLNRLRARATRDYAAVINALGGDLPKDVSPARDSLLDEIAPHVWVQAKVGQKWVDLDSAFADATPGKSYCKAERTFAKLPDDLHQRVIVRVIAERLNGGTLKRETSLELTRPVVDLLDRQVFLLHAPAAAGGAARALRDSGADEWAPVLWVDGEATAGKKIAFGPGAAGGKPAGGIGIFEGLPGGDAPAAVARASEFVAEYLEFDVRIPGRKNQVTRRALCDRAGAAWRAAEKPDPKTLRPVARDAHGPLAPQSIHNVVLSAGRHDLFEFAEDLKLLADAARAAPDTAAAPARPAPDAGATDAPQGDPEAALAARLWPLALQNLCCVLWADHAFLPALNSDPAARFYCDSPRILLFGIGPGPAAGAQGEPSVDFVTDLHRDTIRAVAPEDAGSAALARGKIWYGVLEGALEYEWAAQQAAAVAGDATGVSATSATLDEGGVVVLRPDQPPAEAPAATETAARVAAALSAGDTLLVPAGVLSDAEGRHRGWWAVSAAGDTRAVWGDDLHGMNGRLDPSRIFNGRGLQGNSFRPARSWYVDEDALRRPARRSPRGGRGGGGNEYLTLLQNVSIPISQFFGSATGQWITVGVATGSLIIAGVVAFS